MSEKKLPNSDHALCFQCLLAGDMLNKQNVPHWAHFLCSADDGWVGEDVQHETCGLIAMFFILAKVE